MNWSSILSDWATSAPGLVVSLVLAFFNWRKTRRHIDAVTKAQTAHLEQHLPDKDWAGPGQYRRS